MSSGPQGDEIRRRFWRRELTNQKTRLGSGIGFHGWIDEWSDDDPHLTWGCVVMENGEIARLYDRIPTGAMAILF